MNHRTARISPFALLAIIASVLVSVLFVGWWARGLRNIADQGEALRNSAEEVSTPGQSESPLPSESLSSESLSSESLPPGAQPRASVSDDINHSQRTAMDAAVQQFLAKGDIAQARSLIASWQSRGLDKPQLLYLTGVCDWYAGNLHAAEVAFEQTLAIESGHPHALAYLGLVLEQQERISDALPYYQSRLALDPHSEAIRIDLARVLRKLGRSSEAEVVLPTPATQQVSRALALEMAERTYAIGQYAASVAWFTAADMQAAQIAETLRTAASAMAFSGSYLDAQQLFARVDDAQDNSRHTTELQRRLQIDPNDTKARADLQQLSTNTSSPVSQSSGSALYDTKCAACHGSAGAADGRAARFLFPRPRNFQSENFRLVGTVNAVASPSDIANTIRRGMPGTSMPAFDDLSEPQLLSLAELVLQFRRAGLQQQLSSLESDGRVDQVADETLVATLVAQRTTPAEPLEIPHIQESSEAILRGSLAFEQLGCSQCHGDQATRANQTWLYDEAERPAVPRDLARDFMKGGDDAASLFKRIRLGMPGTPHPALESPAEQIVDLVLFCRSLSQYPKQTTTNQQRYQRAVQGF